ncbi:hypothetical protein CR51_35935 [Caballeronia megalochromosomata]|nr:hypothetical protein CR51_35935 [Caballeronia megalochromosomata]
MTTDEPTFRLLLAEKAAIAQRLVLRAAPILMGAVNQIPKIFGKPDAILPENTPEDLRKRFDRAWWSDGAMYARAHLLENGFPATYPLLGAYLQMGELGGGSGPFHQCPFCGAKARGDSDGARSA